jgi:hypothetical protein
VLGDNWLLVGGQMVFLHEVERRSTDIRPTDDVDVVVNLRAEPAGLARVHEALLGADFMQDAPGRWAPSGGRSFKTDRHEEVFDGEGSGPRCGNTQRSACAERRYRFGELINLRLRVACTG